MELRELLLFSPDLRGVGGLLLEFVRLVSLSHGQASHCNTTCYRVDYTPGSHLLAKPHRLTPENPTLFSSSNIEDLTEGRAAERRGYGGVGREPSDFKYLGGLSVRSPRTSPGTHRHTESEWKAGAPGALKIQYHSDFKCLAQRHASS